MSVLASRLHGIVPPLSTPLTEEFEIDTKSLERLIAFQLEAGVHGIFALGSTGEVAFLSDKQRATVLDVVVRCVAGQVPVLAGTIDMTTARIIEHARAAEQAGVNGLVVTAPFYTRVGQAEISEHFRLVHAAVELPLLAYDIPVAVHSKIEPGTLLQLVKEQVVQGVKDSSGDEANFRGLLLARESYPDFLAFTGSELLVDAALMIGASGAVPGLGNVDPAGYVRLYEAARAGDWQAARQEQERLYRLFEIIKVGLGRMAIGSSAMGAFKTALQLRGIIATNVVGRPQLRLNAAETEQIRQALHTAQLL
ncbi:dihydrodipicolinate synthase family protein [Ktedonosporobacter rubrisoli]|uniref:Dihydrodipicolinate synthase family protein n=1 Tax=Ktedonosporobacter rubrisoli TaxID=2509675 RepID=A0A4P6JKQ2_KTERU|nr:dihydrodipicolinate synthase family protein [Ktedonosporobacter rubrisoli]QBD75552.1 dihydrodipicolinate synthase family protein [Ktedonosporobacter rubrisoli]